MFNSFINRIIETISNNYQSENYNYNNPHSVEILKHSKNYSKLLDIYVDSAKQNMTMKKWFKIIFFIVTMCSLVAIVILFFVTLLYVFSSFNKFNNLSEVTIEAILSIISVIIPVISSLIVAFIKIPEIIAQYLFNAQEDENMSLIIKNIQDYDTAMFSMEQRLEELLNSLLNESTFDSNDDFSSDNELICDFRSSICSP